MPTVLPVHDAAARVERDRNLLLELVTARAEEVLVAPYAVMGGPLGDSCESLRDLVAHVSMWDEINLAVLTEARLGRRHWSLDPRWESPEAGQMLNASGVAAGRALPVGMVMHRFAVICDALLAEMRSYAEETWLGQLDPAVGPEHSAGSLAQYVMTVPGMAPYWHAAIHLGKLAEVAA